MGGACAIVLFTIWTDACAPLSKRPTHSHTPVESMNPVRKGSG